MSNPKKVWESNLPLHIMNRENIEMVMTLEQNTQDLDGSHYAFAAGVVLETFRKNVDSVFLRAALDQGATKGRMKELCKKIVSETEYAQWVTGRSAGKNKKRKVTKIQVDTAPDTPTIRTKCVPILDEWEVSAVEKLKVEVEQLRAQIALRDSKEHVQSIVGQLELVAEENRKLKLLLLHR